MVSRFPRHGMDVKDVPRASKEVGAGVSFTNSLCHFGKVALKVVP